MEVKILYGGLALVGGWFWFFMFLRQFFFNIMTAYPLIGKMKKLDKELIAIGATRYTTVSLIVTGLLSALVAFLVLYFSIKKSAAFVYLNFIIGAIIAFAMFITKLGYRNKPMFDLFCDSYYRFVPDDELRTAIYNKKLGQIKSRLKVMGFDGTFIPEFKAEKK